MSVRAQAAAITLFVFLSLLSTGCMTARPLLVVQNRDAVPAHATLITQVRVFTGLSDSLSEPLDVLLAEGRIFALGAPGTLVVPANVDAVDGTGKTLLPGLIDCHVHLGGGDGTPPWDSQRPNVDAQAAALLYSGVTTILSAGRDTDPREYQERLTKR